MLFLLFGSVFGWRKQKKKIEAARRYRAAAHSSERARLAAIQFSQCQSVSISGVVCLAETVLVGYRKPFPADGKLFPGEKMEPDGRVVGTWVAWMAPTSAGDVEKLDRWCKDKAEVILRFDPIGSDLCIFDPLSQVEAKLQLSPN